MAWVGLGKRVNRPSSSIALAPWLVSSPGWAIMTSVPDHWPRIAAMPPRGADPGGHMGVVAAGVHDRRSRAPRGCVPRTRLAKGRPVCSSTGSASMSARSISTGPGPFSITATTPVPPTPVVTVKPSRRASAAMQAGAARLLHAELGIGVEIAVERHQRPACRARIAWRERRWALRRGTAAHGHEPQPASKGGEGACSSHGDGPHRRGHELDHVEQGFVMGTGEDDPPAAVADPLDHADQVALAVAAVAQGARLVAEHRACRGRSSAGRCRERCVPTGRCEPVSLVKCEPPALARDPAAEGRIGDIIEHGPAALRAELDRPAAHSRRAAARRRAARRRARTGRRRARSRPHWRRRGLGQRLDPGVAPVAQPARGRRSVAAAAPVGRRALGRHHLLARGGSAAAAASKARSEGQARPSAELLASRRAQPQQCAHAAVQPPSIERLAPVIERGLVAAQEERPARRPDRR